MKRLALVTWRLPQTPIDELEQARRALDENASQGSEDRPFELVTCQRVIRLAQASPDETPEAVCQRLIDDAQLPPAERRVGFEAFAHLVRVTASLDALVPGEDQVPNQMRSAVDEQQADLDPELHSVLQRVLGMARSVRGEAGFAGCSASMAEPAVRALPDDATVTVVGTGTMAEHVVDELPDGQPAHVVSRDRERAVSVAPDQARAWTRETYLDDPPAVDALVLCTRSPDGEHVVSEAEARKLAEASPGELSIVDLGVPRNLEPDAGTVPGLRHVTLDGLARFARPSGEEAKRLASARRALEEALGRERQRVAKEDASDRVRRLREAIDDEIDTLVAELDEVPLRRRLEWKAKASGSVAHIAQSHLMDALKGEKS